jgi:hypothetical protein
VLGALQKVVAAINGTLAEQAAAGRPLTSVIWVRPVAIRNEAPSCGGGARIGNACAANVILGKFSHMSFQRSQLYGAAATHLVRSQLGRRVTIVDGWTPTAMDRKGACGEHYDDLYCGKGRGFVSRAVANIILGVVCDGTPSHAPTDTDPDDAGDLRQIALSGGA